MNIHNLWRGERVKVTVRPIMKLWGERPQQELKTENTVHQGLEEGEKDFTKRG